MPSNPSDRSNNTPKSNNTPGRPIRDDEDLVADEEAQANDLQDQAPYQARPLVDEPRAAREKETSTGARADRAAGVDTHRDQLEDSEEAFERSRGSHEPRTPGYQRD